MADREIYVAREGAVFEVDGTPVFIQQGTTARAGHPILKGREHLFEPLVPDFEVTAEAQVPAKADTTEGAPKRTTQADQGAPRSRAGEKG